MRLPLVSRIWSPGVRLEFVSGDQLLDSIASDLEATGALGFRLEGDTLRLQPCVARLAAIRGDLPPSFRDLSDIGGQLSRHWPKRAVR
jgi:hypothetical protein